MADFAMEMVKLEIIEIKDPGNFTIKKLGNDKSQHGDFQEMMDCMTEYLDMAQDRGEPVYRPKGGEVCAAQKRDGSWHRVLVEGLDRAENGRKLRCYLLDLGTHQSINVNRFHKLPSKFKDMPAQVYRCCLSGVSPLMLSFDETDTGLGVQHRPTRQWDIASVKFMNKSMEESCGCRCEIVQEKGDNCLCLRLYFNIMSEWVCFNDELVRLKYAAYCQDDDYRLSQMIAHSKDTNNHNMPNLSPCSESDDEKKEQQRKFIQEKLKSASFISPSTHCQNQTISSAYSNMQGNHQSRTNVTMAGQGVDKAILVMSPQSTTHNLVRTPGRGRASLHQVLKSIRPGGLVSNPKVSSVTPESSMTTTLPQPTSNPKSSLTLPTVTFSNVDSTYHLPPNSHPCPLTSPFLSSSSSSPSILSSGTGVGRGLACLDGSSLSPVRKVIDFDNCISSSPGRSEFIGRGAKTKAIHPSSPQGLKDKERGPGQLTDQDVRDDSIEDREVYLGKMEGQRLLQQLRQRSGQNQIDTESVLPKIMRPDKPELFPSLGTLAYGKGVPMALYSVMDCPFLPIIKKVLIKSCEREIAQGIEAYMWPAILAGRNVVGVSQPKLENEMVYIPPLLNLISSKKDYMSLQQRMGPLVLVVVPTWRRAMQVFDLVELFTGGNIYENKQIRSIALYAGGAEESNSTKQALVRGCEVLISTPCSLLRSLTEGVTSLKRLCHLVLDNADVLACQFKNEIFDLMQMYSSVIKDRGDIKVPHQVLMFSKQWNNEVDDFRLRFTKQPILSFSSRLEASVYGDVKQVVLLCRSQQRLTKLCDLVDSLSNSHQRVIAWTSDIEEAKEMAKMINSRGVYCLLIHHGMDSDHEVEEVRQQWFHSSQISNKLVVLVSTDQCYQDLAITDANSVIHYDMPSSRTRFGNRLACMLQHFSDRLGGIESDYEPVSHVIVTEKCPTHARSFYDVLRRCKSTYPPALQDFIKGYHDGLQTQGGTELCSFLKSFGFCLNQDRCEERHVLFPERDLKTGETSQDSLPVHGEVKLKVMRVVTANRFYCRLMEHRSIDNLHTSLKEEYKSLMIEMSLFYSKDSNHVPYVPPKDLGGVGLCGFKIDEIVHRARVMELKEGTRAAPMKQCKVWLVDDGLYQYGTIDQLVKLPQRLAEVPYQAVEVFVCRIKPIDKEAEWTDKADIFMDELIKDKILIGRVVLRLGMSMWLDPLVHQVTLKGVGKANDKVIRQEILANNFATINPEHIQLLCELCRGKVEIPETVMQRYFDYCLEIEMTQETLTSDKEFHEVNIAAVSSPGLFYIQKWENIDVMDKLEAKINKEMSAEGDYIEHQKKADAGYALECGSVGLAKSVDGRWYRAKIISLTENDEWEVFFLDYGDKESVPKDMVRPLPRELAKLPCQAIECEMANLSPTGQDWSSDTVDCIVDLSHFVDGEKKRLSVKVHSKKEASFSMSQKLAVDVFACADKVWFSQELVWKHLATCNTDEEHNLRPVLKKITFKSPMFFITWDKLPFLCANIYWAEDSSTSCRLAKELKELLSMRTERWDELLVEREVLSPLIQIIGYVSDHESHEIILDALVTCCMDSRRVLEVAVNENLTFSLLLCLEQVTSLKLQIQAAKAVSRLISLPRFMESSKMVGMDSVFIHIIQWHKEKSVDPQLLDNVCRVLCTYIQQDGQSSILASHDETIVEQILKSLRDENLREEYKKPWLQLLSSLASSHDTRLPRKLMRESTIKLLIQQAKTLQGCMCIRYLLLVFQSLVDNNRKHVIILLEYGLKPVLVQICNQNEGSPVSIVCKRLLSSLVLQFPPQERLAGRRIDRSDENTGRVCIPPVAWTETCFKIQLTVKVKNASVDDFDISCNSVQCSVLSDGTVFKLDWELYDNIIPGKSRVEPSASRTVVSLRKKTEGKWGRLLKQKNKPPNLSPDFDHLYDSEEEDADGLCRRNKGIFDNLPSLPALHLYSSEEEDSDMAIYSNSDKDEPQIDYESFLHNCYSQGGNS